MLKITDLKMTAFRTIHGNDAVGNRTSERVYYQKTRPVKTMKGWPRFGHFLIDLFIYRGIAYLLGGLFIEIFIPSSNTELIIFSFLLLAFSLFIYYSLSESAGQRSIGKYLTKSRVIDEYGNTPTISQILTRSISRLIPFNVLSALNDTGRCWHDKISNTFVVSDAEYEKLQRLLAEQQGDFSTHLMDDEISIS